MAYVLTDQAYAVAITRWTGEAVRAGEGGPAADPERRVPYYLGAGFTLWVNWQICTIVGVLIGAAVPKSLPLDFAVPLVLLVLLVPAITSKPAGMAALFGSSCSLGWPPDCSPPSWPGGHATSRSPWSWAWSC